MISDKVNRDIEGEKVSLMLLQGLDADTAERRAIAKIAAEQKLTDITRQSTSPPKVSQQPVDPETKQAADEFRRMMMQDFDISLIEDLHTYTDEMLVELLERDGLA
jgi:hypothetical protein